MGTSILHIVTVRGRGHTWCVETYITRETAQDWQDDGIDVSEVLNSIPHWWVDAGLPVRLWCFAQDVFNFKNPWRK